MKQIKLSKFIQEYPVGENIKSYFDSCKEVAEIIEKEFPNKSITFWCRGSSGAMISALVCQHLDDVNIFHVKKQNEIAHYSSINHYNEINIIIDDFNYLMQDYYMDNALKGGWDRMCVPA